jgi:uncharacterized protein (DUF58 family)
MPTKRGWAAFGAGVALWIGSRFAGSADLHMISVGIVALPFLAALFVQWSRVRIEVHRQLSAVRVFPSTRVVVTLRVENRGPGTAPFLLLEDALPADLGRSARVVATGIPPRNHQVVSYSVVCRRRGRFTIGPLSIFITDPFGLARVRIQTQDTNQLIVYPEVEEIPVSHLALQGAGAGESAVRHLHRTAAEFYTMREYVTGDDLRRIHWPSVAHTGKLMIRQDESTRRSVATVFLDNRTSSLGAFGSPAFERAVSVTATVGRALAAAGFAVRLARVDSPSHPVTEERLLETLAEVGPDRTRSAVDSLAALRGSALTDSTLALITAPPNPAEVAALSRVGVGFGKKIAIFVYPVSPGALPEDLGAEVSMRASAARSSLVRAGWDVMLLEPDGRLAEVWNRTRFTRAHAVVSHC